MASNRNDETIASPASGLHKASGRARIVVRDAGGQRREIYLGRHGSADAAEAYAHWCRVLQADGGVVPVRGEPPTVAKLTANYAD